MKKKRAAVEPIFHDTPQIAYLVADLDIDHGGP